MSIAVPKGVALVPRGARRKRDRARHDISALLAIVAGTLGILGGCPAAPEEAETITLDVVFDRTGTLPRDGTFRSIAQPFVMTIGDDTTNTATCAFVSINLSSIAANAEVTRVVLNAKATIDDNDPFGEFGAITVDHVNVVGGIVASNYAGGTVTAGIATIPSFPATTRQNVAIDVTNAVKADLAAGRPISSFRFRFDAAPSVDAQSDQVVFESSIADPNQRPSASVTIRQ